MQKFYATGLEAIYVCGIYILFLPNWWTSQQLLEPIRVLRLHEDRLRTESFQNYSQRILLISASLVSTTFL